jgi:Flp pilus assembly protein TadD
VAIRRAFALDPYSPYISLNMGYLLYLSGDYDGAVEASTEGIAAHPDSPLVRAFRGAALVQAGRVGEGIEDLEVAAEQLAGRNLIPQAYLGFAYGMAGRTADAEQVLRTLREASTERFVNPEYLAMVNIGLGRVEEAMDQLNLATDARTDWPVFFPVDPVTEAVRSNPRYQALLDRVGLGHLKAPNDSSAG